MTVLPTERTISMPLPHHDPAEQIAKLRLAALRNAVPSARRFVRNQLPCWRLDDLVDDVALVVSELTSNAVKATGPRSVPASYADLHDAFLVTVILRLRLTLTDLYAELWDASDDLPVPADPSMFDEGGRGLVPLAECSDQWGYYPSQIGGKVTWSRWQVKPQEAHTWAHRPYSGMPPGIFRSPIHVRGVPLTRWQTSPTTNSGDRDAACAGRRRRMRSRRGDVGERASDAAGT